MFLRSLIAVLLLVSIVRADTAPDVTITTTFANGAGTVSTCDAATCTGISTDPGVVDCRAPCPRVFDAGTATVSNLDQALGTYQSTPPARFGEKKITDAAWDATLDRLTCTNCFEHFLWHKASVESDGDEAEWTASAGNDTHTEFYYVGATTFYGQPKAVSYNNGTFMKEGLVGSLNQVGEERWAYGCHADDGGCGGFNRLYILLPGVATDPDDEAANSIQIYYGSGVSIYVQHVDLSSNTISLARVLDWMDPDTLQLPDDELGSDNLTDVTIYQAVNPWNDLRYEWSTSCVGADTCVAPITNTEMARPNCDEEVQMTTFTGPAYPVVLGDVNTDGTISSFGTATVTLSVYDDANAPGSALATQTIELDDLTSAYEREIWINHTTGVDADNDGAGPNTCLNAAHNSTFCTLAAPCKTWECAWSQLWRHSTASDSIRVYLNRGDTFTVVTAPGNDYANKANASRNVLIAPYGTGADPIIEQGGGSATFRFNQASGTTNHNVRIVDVSIHKTTGTADIFTFGATKSLLMRTTVLVDNVGSALYTLSRGFNNNDYDDSILWDNHWTQNKAQYVVYDSLNSNSGARVAYVGNYMYLDGAAAGGAVLRTNTLGPQVFAYNYLYTTATSSGSPVLRLMYAQGIYLYHDHLVAEGANGGCMNNGCGLACGSGTSNDILIEGMYCDNNNNTPGDASLTIIAERATGDTDPLTPGNILVRNSVFSGGERGITCSSTRAPDLRVFNNTFYTAKTEVNGIPFISSTGNGSFHNWVALNNIAQVVQTDGDNDMFVTTGNFDYLGGIAIDNNIWSQGGSTGDFGTIAGVSYANDAAWAAASGKSEHDNDEAAPLLSNPTLEDFRLCTAIDIPDDSCTGASPAIDRGQDLPTVTLTFCGIRYTGSEMEVGAFDESSSGTVTEGTCCECDGDCTDTIQADCLGPYVWTSGETCGVEGCPPVGACCTAVQGNCTEITDTCCAETQWLTGDTCADCEWKCCERDGTCSDVTAAVCGAFTSEVFTWGSTCGTCPTVACCTDAVTCEDLTETACLLENKLPGAGGSVCGVGDPCAALFPATLNARMNLLGVGR